MEEHSTKETKEALEYTGGYDDLTALHWVCYYGAPVSLVRSMILGAPNILTIATKYGSLLFDYAVKGSASIEVLRVLIEANQQTLFTKTQWGLAPLSWALRGH